MASLVLAGNTSGSITISSPSVSGTNTLTLPASTGTFALTAAPTFTGQATIPTINLTGGQIVFPATQSASADANTLDDYEEGTWTPSQGGGLTVVGTFSSSGKYTKIGRMVHLSGVLSSTTSVAATAGALIAANLPFNAIQSPEQTGTSNVAAGNAGAIIEAYVTNVYSIQAISATTAIHFNVAYQV